MASNSGVWQDYVNCIVHRMDYDAKKYEIEHLCDSAASYGLDGAPWAWTEKFPEINAYTHTIEGLSAADTKKVEVDEFKICLEVASGNRNVGD